MRSISVNDRIYRAGKSLPIEDEKKLPLGLRVLAITLLSGTLWAGIAALGIWII
jgi:hypothetical protein